MQLRYREAIQNVKDRRQQAIALTDVDLSKSQPEDRAEGVVLQLQV